MTDILLREFFDKKRWTDAIEKGNEKNIDKNLLRNLCSPEKRLSIYYQIRDGTYKIKPPHEARIPKDDNTYRTVYINEDTDRIILSIINDMFFDMFPEFIHPKCKSYQKGIGCGKIVKDLSKKITKSENDIIGIKADLSKYFDSVPIEYIDQVFDCIENKTGKSAIINLVRNYYHDDTVIDYDKNTIKKYSSLRQGCAVAAYLADSVLKDMDEKIDKLDVTYVRYSDDILIIGNEWEKGYAILKESLAQKQLILNPKKVEILSKDKWFQFLGFSIKNDKISLSKKRIKTFQKEIEIRTIKSKHTDIDRITKNINDYLYTGDGVYSWATSVLPVINVEQDITTLNGFVMDAIRAAKTKKTNIGGLGYSGENKNAVIVRGKGSNVKVNKEKIPFIANYKTIQCMKNALMIARPLYQTLQS